MKELIQAINDKCFSCDVGWVVEFDDVKDLINKALEGKVMVDQWRLLQIENNATYSAFNLLEPDNSQHFNEMVASVSHIMDTTSPRDCLLMVVRDLNALLSTEVNDNES